MPFFLENADDLLLVLFLQVGNTVALVLPKFMNLNLNRF